MKKLARILFFAMIGLLFVSCSGDFEKKEENASGVFMETEIVKKLKLGNGWNLGNTLDAYTNETKNNLGLSTETSWGMPGTTQVMIKAISAKGFKTIRIPVSWHNHITDLNYTIDSEWLARVKKVVDWSINSGLTVIINIHHDNLSEAQMSSTYGFCVPEDANSPLKTRSISYIKAVWNQVASYFKNYDENLVFEVLNEPRCIGKSYEWSTNGYDSKVAAANKIIMEYEKAALDTIRATGGKNASRYVMVPPYAANPDMRNGWSLPSDSASGKLIVSVHAYNPYEFCMKDMSVTVFNSSHKGSIDYLFSSLGTDYVSKGIPVVMGEASASDKNNTAERKKWVEYYYAKAKALGIPVILWDNMVVWPNGDDAGERHGWFNRKDLTWYYPELVDLMVR
ncbi:MAG: glycoside hydrolase family 5 protein [Treponema sp.]|uniref:glycoside hydrolase family 5 protein n=1 Tax=Treponema sp. TaxID=166 RepID=UPI0025E464A9|nr:glycoside hydrolase family 5 protein [Treponema sp.]MBR0496562.1 glycoside hydrolase family 5 protein [Treponema sp.]